MSKKLLASLMAGAMFISQATSLDVAAKSNLREFGAENKNFIEGVLAGGLGTVLVGTIAYLVHTCDAVVDIKSEDFERNDYTGVCNAVYENLNKGKIVRMKDITFVNKSSISIGTSSNTYDCMSYYEFVNMMRKMVCNKFTDAKVYVTVSLCNFSQGGTYHGDVELKLKKHSNNRLELIVMDDSLKDDK